jgi:asparagine N-glycosylation enzyme membrane subunit Stt3
MRKVALVFATLFLLATTGLGLLATNRGLKDAKDIEEIVGPYKGAMAEAGKADPQMAELSSLAQRTGKLKAGAVLFGIAAVLALGLLIVTFAGKPIVPMLAGAVALVAIIGTFVSPQYDLGPLAPASARSLGYVITVLALAGAGAAWGAAALKRRRQVMA